MEKLLPQNYAIYDTVYGSETPTEQYYTIKFDKIPSKFLDGGTFYDPMIIDELKKLGFVEEARCNIKNKRHDSSSQSLFVYDSKEIIIRVYSSNNNNTNKKSKDDLLLLDFSYDIKKGELKEQLDLDAIKIHQRP